MKLIFRFFVIVLFYSLPTLSLARNSSACSHSLKKLIRRSPSQENGLSDLWHRGQEKFYKGVDTIKSTLGWSLGFTAQTLFYPLIAPVKVPLEIKKQWGKKSPKRILFSIASLETPKVLGFWMISREFDDYYVTGFELLTFEDRFLEPSNQDYPVVIIDAFDDESDPMRLGPILLEALYKARFKKVFLIRSQSPADLLLNLKNIQMQYGQIGILEFASHGRPGSAELGQTKFTKETLEGLTPMDDIMAPGGILRFFNCSLGRGKAGEDLAKEFGRVFLPQGGRVVMSELPVVSGWADLVLGFLTEQTPLTPGPFFSDLSKFLQTPGLVAVAPIFGLDKIESPSKISDFAGENTSRAQRVRVFEFAPN